MSVEKTQGETRPEAPKPIEKAWLEFAEATMNQEIPEHSVQYRDMRRSFYAGFYEMFRMFKGIAEMDHDAASEAGVFAMLEAIPLEMEQFVADVKVMKK